MENIITATGKIFSTDYVVTIPEMDIAYIRIIGSTLLDVAYVFSNPLETALIRTESVELVGYTKLLSISFEGDVIKISIQKGR